ncbi:MAG: hypothetical protein HQL21_09910, partial [Candidatus Omnitrophica bacterium]|nr:hypothetical protein [Candidatus Omnitrophota bacterium]
MKNLFLSCLVVFILFPVFLSASWAAESSWREFLKGSPLPKPAFALNDPGSSTFVDYEKYGTFKNLGQEGYYFEMKDMKGLRDAIGEGVFPNTGGVFKDPDYKRIMSQGDPQASRWDLLTSGEFQKAFFVWSQAAEDPGVKTFFTAQVLEKAGHILPALKAYHAVLVHFPRSACWGADGSFVWYVAPASIGAMERLCGDYSDLNCELKGATFDIKNGEDTDLKNDVIKVNPGKIVLKTFEEKIAALPQMSSLKILETRGKGHVQLVKYSNGQWQMRVEGKPYFIRGITFTPT